MSTFASDRMFGAPARRHVPARAGALARSGSARAALLTVVMVALAAAALGVLDFRRSVDAAREDAAAGAQRLLSVVRGSASEAAWQLNADLAHGVVAGLLTDEAVASAALSDNFGQTLAREAQARPAAAGASDAAPAAGVTTYELPLFYARGDGASDRVGTLTLELAPDVVGRRAAAAGRADAIRGVTRILGFVVAGLGIFMLLSRRTGDAR